MKAKTTHHRLLKKLAARLEGRPNIVGYGHAIRVKNGAPTRQKCLAVFVTRKMKPEEMDRRHLIPKSVTIDGKRNRLDVVGVGRLRRQAAAFGDSLSCDVFAAQRTKGTPSGYFDFQGRRRVLSCAHVIWGESGMCPAPPVTISSSKPTAAGYAWTTFATSTPDGRLDNGTQTTNDWGYIDCASAQLDAASAAQIPLGPPLKCFVGKTAADFLALSGQRVSGQGLITSCRGVIHSVLCPFAVGSVKSVDFVVLPESAGETLTIAGDSGMIWKLDDGTVVGIHSLGNVPEPPDDPDGPSTFTVGTFIQRALQATRATDLH